MRAVDLATIAFDDDGLIPAIVQDRVTRRVLMMGWMDSEAFEQTTSSGFVHFHSRRRDQLWKKGETSGNTLTVSEIAQDCDGDALLVLADPAGPTCHTGARSCWEETPAEREPGFADLEVLWATILDRAERRPEGSYTTTLLNDGDLAARKVTEEAVEVLMAARDHARSEATDVRLAEELADLLYHILVLCAERGVSPRLALDVLASRRS